MRKELLKQFENKKVTIFLRGCSLKYTNIFLKIIDDNLIRFFDAKERENIFLEPSDVLLVSQRKEREDE